MTIAPVKVGGWGTEEALTSAQMNALQAAVIDESVAVATELALKATVANLAIANAALALESRRTLAVRALHLREIRTEGTLPADTAESMAAISTGTPGHWLMALKSGVNGCMEVTDIDRIKFGADVASITSLVRDAARNGTRIVVVGTGGNSCAYTTSAGSSWTAGGAVGATPERIIYNAVYGRFILCTSAGSAASWSTDGTSWTPVVTGLDSVGAADGSLAVNASGQTFLCGSDNGVVALPEIFVSNNGGTSWADSGGTVPNAAQYDEPGAIVGNAGATVWHVGRASSGAELRVCSSANGIAWTLIHTVVAATAIGIGAAFTAEPRILCCQDTGLLVCIAALVTGTHVAIASADGGLTWTAPVKYYVGGSNSFAVAGGRLFCTYDAMLFGSDGIGSI